MKLTRLILGAGFLLLAFVPTGLAQSQFLISARQGDVIQTVTDGATLTFSAEGLRQPVSATLTVTYRGASSALIGGFDLSGTTDFTVGASPELPATLNPNDSVVFVIQFSPTTTARSSVRFRINFTEGRNSSGINFNLTGITPDFGFSYAPLPGGNQNSVPAGGTVVFPDTTVNADGSVLFVISNRGSGPGTLNGITLSGANFKLSGLPILPAVVQPSQDVRVTLTFSPLVLGTGSGTVRIDFVGRSAPVNLTAAGVGTSFSYELVTASGTQVFTADQTLTLPQTNLTQTTSVVVRVRNNGNSDGVITAIQATGAAEITLSNVPFLPLTVASGGAFTFTINFAPTQPVTTTARLRIGDAFFGLSAVGSGSTLTYALTVGSATSTISANGSVVLPPAQLGGTSTGVFQISNTGNASAAINSISVTAGSAFTLARIPALPAQIAAGQSLSFSIVFTPVANGSATATLSVNSATFTVTGAGADPPPLPAIAFPGSSTSAEAASQVGLGVTLASGYPVDLTGKLTITFASDVFNDDPAIQFAAGGRVISFTVPANTTRAVFAPNASEARLQTGTVAGTITVTATFATTAGNVNLTPVTVPAPATTIAIRPAAPRLRSVQLSARTTTGFTLLVTGYATTRSVTSMDFTFTAANDPTRTDLKLDTSSLSLNVDGPFTSWFQSTAAQPFGSLFTATVTFNVRGDIDAIQSVAATVGNALGKSGSMAVNLR